MIVCRSKGFIFLRVPKTASTSISKFLLDHLKFDSDIDVHSSLYPYHPSLNCFGIVGLNSHPSLNHFLKHKLISQKDISNLKVYGVLREPVERTLSLFKFILHSYEGIEISKYNQNNIIELGLELFDKNEQKFTYVAPIKNRFLPNDAIAPRIPLYPQSSWLVHYNEPISNILVYPKFKKFLLEYTGRDDVGHELKSVELDSAETVSDSLVREIKKIYNEDFTLWKKYGHL